MKGLGSDGEGSRIDPGVVGRELRIIRDDLHCNDIVSMDRYRSIEVADRFADGVRALVAQGKPVAITEFGAELLEVFEAEGVDTAFVFTWKTATARPTPTCPWSPRPRSGCSPSGSVQAGTVASCASSSCTWAGTAASKALPRSTACSRAAIAVGTAPAVGRGEQTRAATVDDPVL